MKSANDSISMNRNYVQENIVPASAIACHIDKDFKWKRNSTLFSIIIFIPSNN